MEYTLITRISIDKWFTCSLLLLFEHFNLSSPVWQFNSSCKMEIVNVTKLIFSLYSLICSYAVEFVWWDETAYQRKKVEFPLLIWYFQELCTFCTSPILAVNYYINWDKFMARRSLTQVVINMFVVVVYPFCCSLQYIFQRHSDQVVSLVSQTNKIARHFEQSK